MDGARVGGQGGARSVPDFLEEGSADQEDDVGAVERLADGHRVEGQAQAEVRMRARHDLVGTNALAPHRRAEPLGQRRHLGRRARGVVAGDDDRSTAGQQQLGGRLDAGRVGLGSAVETAGRKRLDVGVLLQHVDRQGDEDGAGRRVGGDLQRAVQDQRELVGALDLHAPLGQGRGHRHQIVTEHRPAQPQARILLAGGHHERRARLQRVVEHAERVAQPGRHVDVDDSRLAAGLRVVARGAERHALVQGHDVAELRIVQQRIEDRALGGAGIAEDELDAMTDEALHEHVPASHAFTLLSRKRTLRIATIF